MKMRLNERIEKWQYHSGMGIACIGVIHIFSVCVVFNNGFDSLSKDNFASTVYMFLATGLALIYTGILIVYHSNGIRHLETQHGIRCCFVTAFCYYLD